MQYSIINDVHTNLKIQLSAFAEYQDDLHPSSALDETIGQIEQELLNGSQILIGTINEQPVATVRFQIQEQALYFYRLSVLPKEQGNGYAKKLVAALENYAKKQNLNEVQCNVRYNVPRNLYLYASLDYEIIDEFDVIKSCGASIKTVTMAKKL